MLFHKVVGKGPPMVILHGLFGSLDNWMGIARSLGHHYTVYLVDHRNHGNSFHHSLFNYPAMSRDLEHWIEAQKITEFNLLGHSMGGKVAMHFAQNNPDAVRKLLVIDIGPKAYSVSHEQILKGLTEIDPQKLENRQQADIQLSSYVPEAGVRQFLLKNLKRNGTHFQWKLNVEVIRDNIEQVGKALPTSPVISTPTLFLRGGQSPYILDNDIPGILEQFPQATVETMEQAGHWLHSEDPTGFLEILGEILVA